MLNRSSFVLLAAASTAFALTEFNWTSIEPSTSLNWTACYADGLDCARLLVPLDYASPNNSTTAALAITRFRSTSPSSSYRGPILLNPGGPGGSGVEFAVVYGSEIAGIVGAEYDIVGFDPRGVSFSTPTISWFLNDAERALWYPPNQNTVLPSLNETALGLPYAYARAQVQSQLAAARDADFLQYMTTDYTAQDMLTITEAFGFEKLKYWGVSYGTVLGQTFAALFPDKVERVVIDGVLPIDDWYSANLTETMLDTNQVLDAFFTSCFEAGPSVCAFHNNASSPSDIATALVDLLLSLQQKPVPAVASLTAGNAGYGVVDYSLVKNVIFQSLYQPYKEFPALAQALADLAAGNASTIYAASGPQEFTCEPGAAPVNKMFEAGASITCTDVRLNDTLADLQSYYAGMAAISEFADVWVPVRIACAGWKVHRPGQYTGPTGPTNTSAPLLVIGNLRDPVTSWPGANQTAEVLFPGAGFLTYNASGHTSFIAPSTCLDAYVGAYFRNGTLPPAGAVCQPDVQLFATNASARADGGGVSRRGVPGLTMGGMGTRKGLFSF
ncbi:AB hydrolase-1 domain-containing protein [Mycena chlorophos]|uniref:AB hydrolase-1 domain-containing protein n=1 Tax=Mycena chlorophos TaxID=658473 RepID=A0A8H6SVI3_MYCCL|nr:AB hydrolase-1 domain-containing protein [Mycena chlorophos]